MLDNIKGNGLNSYQIKIIAIIAMLIDHIPHIFTDDDFTFFFIPFHFIGRITAPIFFYFIAVGFRYTHDKKKYSIRLLIFALISQIPYVLFFLKGPLFNDFNIFNLNIIFSMFFCLLTLISIHDVKNIYLKVVLIVISALLCCFTSYGLLSIAFTVFFDLMNELNADKKQFSAGYLVLLLFSFSWNFLPAKWLLSSMSFMLIFEDPLFLPGFIIFILGLILPLKILLLDNRELGGGKKFKFFFYIFYPAHLIILYLIKLFLNY
ncbi:MAG: conjugal transfer protein TraX [Methanobrevibacter sp.]|jgi:hypothetical protein|nr:conjugal transfer protein TraX [Candidatus Methanovirga basalitermitum]